MPRDKRFNSAGTVFLLCLLMLLSVVINCVPVLGASDSGKKVSSRYSVIINKDPFDAARGGGETGDTGEDVPGSSEGIGENYELYGILRTGSIRRAYLKSKKRPTARLRKERRQRKKKHNRPEFRIVSEGDLIDGWKVEEITKSGIVLTSNGKKVRMDVFTSPKSGRKATKPVAMQTRKSAPVPVNTGAKGLASRSVNRKKVPGAPAAARTSQVRKKAPGNPFNRTIRKNLKTGGSASPPRMTFENAPLLKPEDITVPPLMPAGKTK